MVSCWHVTIQAQVCSFGNPCGMYGGRSGTGTGFSPSTSILPCQDHTYNSIRVAVKHSVSTGIVKMEAVCSADTHLPDLMGP